ncbi:hypothetical protein [Nocardia pseudobrasiliensis]|uniref:hypothetical protein n=1 Tax=Nocardia pseudobrasiliensis TaxID=45979 RepID=UPI001FEC78A1|nr:hypothetical protein [Nocardia pseudobrasiliensis]
MLNAFDIPRRLGFSMPYAIDRVRGRFGKERGVAQLDVGAVEVLLRCGEVQFEATHVAARRANCEMNGAVIVSCVWPQTAEPMIESSRILCGGLLIDVRFAVDQSWTNALLRDGLVDRSWTTRSTRNARDLLVRWANMRAQRVLRARNIPFERYSRTGGHGV